MYTWANWTTQQYQHHNVTNIHQAAWYPNQNCAQYSQYSICTLKSQLGNNYRAVNNFVYSQSAANAHTTKENSSCLNSFIPQPPSEQHQTNSTMAAQDFYQLNRYNSYSIHFGNRSALSIDNIRNICGVFGEIVSCKQTGDATGIVFVNFLTEDAAIKSVEGLRNHPNITLRRFKNIQKNKVDSEFTKNYENSEFKKYDYPTSSSSSYGQNNSFDKENNYQKESNNSHQGSEKSFTAEENGTRMINSPLSSNITRNHSAVGATVGSNGNSSEFVATNKRFGAMNESSVDEHDSVPMDLPELIHAQRKCNSASEIKRNGTETQRDMIKKPMEVIEAQEIIVANIEENYGVPAILHLLEKYEPICASPIKVCKSHSLRYCHVFFTNIHHAEAAECDFDDYEWSPSKKLIVLRVNTLAYLASSS